MARPRRVGNVGGNVRDNYISLRLPAETNMLLTCLVFILDKPVSDVVMLAVDKFAESFPGIQQLAELKKTLAVPTVDQPNSEVQS